MKKTRGFLVAVAVATMAFTFSCSSDEGEKEGGESSSSVPSSSSEVPLPPSSSSSSDGGESSSSVTTQESSSSLGSGESSSSVTAQESSSSLGGGESSSSGDHFNPNIPYIDFIDNRDGKTYKSVVIGTQTWMAENLNYNATGSKCYGEGGLVYNVESELIPLLDSEVQANCEKYGRLYDWATAMNNSASSTAVPSGVQGVCPDGWHLPGYGEWDTLITAVGGENTAGIKLKAISDWNDYEGASGNGTDEYGFSALPSGSYSEGSFFGVGNYGHWWGATENDSYYAFALGITYYDEYAYGYSGDKPNLFSVRCVQDTP